MEFEQILDHVVYMIHDHAAQFNLNYIAYGIISEKQIIKILQDYIDYYNSKRPHQGIDQRVPKGYNPQLHGKVLKFPILSGLCNNYLSRVA